MWASAIKKVIEDNKTFCAKLSTWDFGDGELRPAIFLHAPPEESFSMRIVIEDFGTSPFGCRGHKGGVMLFDVILWGDKVMGTSQLDKLANRLWLYLERRRVEVEGFRTSIMMTSPPSFIRDPDGYPGYAIPVEIIFMEN